MFYGEGGEFFSKLGYYFLQMIVSYDKIFINGNYR